MDEWILPLSWRDSPSFCTGERDKAREVFQSILNMQADPMSRALAFHGVGKVKIHEGDFARGLSLIEESVQTYHLRLPIATWRFTGTQKAIR